MGGVVAKVHLRASSYQSCNRAGSVTRKNFVVCSYSVRQSGVKLSCIDRDYRAWKNYICHLDRPVAKAKLFCQKRFITITWAGVFIGDYFYSSCRDLGIRADPPFPMNSSKSLQGNRAMPLNAEKGKAISEL